MSWRTFMIGWTMALVVLLIARPRYSGANQDIGTAVVELTYAGTPHTASHRQWNTNIGHAERVVAPLVVMDVSRQLRSEAHYRLTVEDIANWEEAHGHVPPSAVVMAKSDIPSKWVVRDLRPQDGNTSHFPGFSEDAIRFLVEARGVYGLGTETPETGRSVVLVYRGK